MPSMNDITGDWIVSKSQTNAYRDGWDRIFGKKTAEVEDNVQAEPEAPEEVQVFVDAIQHMLANPNEKLLADQSPTALDNREYWYEWVEKNQKIIDRVPEFSEFRAIHESLKNDLGR